MGREANRGKLGTETYCANKEASAKKVRCILKCISKRSQDVKRSDCSPLSGTCETASEVLSLVLDPTVQEKHTAVSPVEDHRHQGMEHRCTKRSWKKRVCPAERKEG